MPCRQLSAPHRAHLRSPTHTAYHPAACKLFVSAIAIDLIRDDPPRGAQGRVYQGRVYKPSTAPRMPFALPANMSMLRSVRVHSAITHAHLPNPLENALAANWLVESSARCVRTLHISGTNIRSLPTGMPLADIDVSHCRELLPDWLPASSAAQVATLNASSSNLQHLPEGMAALSDVSVSDCKSLAADWLHSSSAAAVVTLDARASSLERLPEGMPLEWLSVARCRDLLHDMPSEWQDGAFGLVLVRPRRHWLPHSSAGHLRELDVRGTLLERMPDEMGSLQRLHAAECHQLQPDSWVRSPTLPLC